jgi:hypothetical protein
MSSRESWEESPTRKKRRKDNEDERRVSGNDVRNSLVLNDEDGGLVLSESSKSSSPMQEEEDGVQPLRSLSSSRFSSAAVERSAVSANVDRSMFSDVENENEEEDEEENGTDVVGSERRSSRPSGEGTTGKNEGQDFLIVRVQFSVPLEGVEKV